VKLTSIVALALVLVGTFDSKARSETSCNEAGPLKLCVVEASVRTDRKVNDGALQDIIASLRLQLTNASESDVSVSLADEPIQLLVGGVAINRLAARGIVGVKVGKKPNQFVSIGSRQSQAVIFTFDQRFPLTSVEPLGQGTTATFSAIFHVVDSRGERSASVSIAGFPIVNNVRP